MKKSILLLAGLISIICISSGVLNANALQQSEWSLRLSWSNSVYYQGDGGTVTVTFYSSCPEELKISYVGIHFDWMSSDTYFPLDLSSSPVGVTSNGQHTFNAISFSIPSSANVGSHSVTVLIKGQQHGLWWYDVSVTSGTQSIYIHDAYEKVYNQLYSEVLSKISNAQSANYQSPDAQSLLQQANTEFSLATSLAQQGKWQDAVSHLNTASAYIDQASAKEQTYQQQKTNNPLPYIGQPDNTLAIIAVLVIIIVVLIGVVLAVILRRNQ